MLRMKPSCEVCNAPLSPDAEAFICSYECTFCTGCSQQMDYVCKNCGGNLERRPKRCISPRIALLNRIRDAVRSLAGISPLK